MCLLPYSLTHCSCSMHAFCEQGVGGKPRGRPAKPRAPPEAVDVGTMSLKKIIKVAYVQEKARQDKERACKAVGPLGAHDFCHQSCAKHACQTAILMVTGLLIFPRASAAAAVERPCIHAARCHGCDRIAWGSCKHHLAAPPG